MYYAGVLLKYLSLGTVEKLVVMASRVVYGDLSKYGIPFPSEGPFTMKMKYGKFPIIDLGTVKKIKSGEIQVRACVRVCAGEYTDSSYLIDTFFVVVPFWVHMKTLKKERKENNNS